MAKKSSKELTGILAFISLMLSAVFMIICAINQTGIITIGGQVISIFQLIAYICLISVVILQGWNYARTLSKTWRIVYIVISVLAILGAFGFINIKVI